MDLPLDIHCTSIQYEYSDFHTAGDTIKHYTVIGTNFQNLFWLTWADCSIDSQTFYLCCQSVRLFICVYDSSYYTDGKLQTNDCIVI